MLGSGAPESKLIHQNDNESELIFTFKTIKISYPTILVYLYVSTNKGVQNSLELILKCTTVKPAANGEAHPT